MSKKKSMQDRADERAEQEQVAPADELAGEAPIPDSELTESTGSTAEIPPPPDSVEALRERVESLEEALLRARAEFQNYQRRAANERSDAIRYANADLIRALLPVLDDLDRAIEHAAASAESEAALLEGVRLVHENMLKALATFGLEPIEAKGKPFDPHVHEALLRQPTGDAEPGTVIEAVARGYKLHDRTLRPARVVVAAEPAA